VNETIIRWDLHLLRRTSRTSDAHRVYWVVWWRFQFQPKLGAKNNTLHYTLVFCAFVFVELQNY